MEVTHATSSPSRREMAAYHARPKSSLKMRWVVLILSCVVMIGTYYSLDIPAAIHHQLQDTLESGAPTAATKNFEFYFNLLFSIYSIPNTVLPFFGGSCVDRVGSSRSLVSFGMLTLAGQLLVSVGGFARSWPIMLAGRFVYGLGGENICVATSTVLNEWFDGGEVALAFAISLATGRLGSVLNNVVSPGIANAISTGAALSVGAFVNFIALAAAFAIGYLERRERKRSSRRAISDMLNVSLLAEADMEEEPEDNNMSGMGFSDRSFGDDKSEGIQIVGEDTTFHFNDDDDERVHLSGVCSFGPLFWLLSLSCMVVYGCVLPFNNVASGILLERNYFKVPPRECTLKYPDRCTSGTFMKTYSDDESNPATNADGTLCPGRNYAPIFPTSLNITRDENATDEETTWDRPSYVYSNLKSSDIDCGDPFWFDACAADYCAEQSKATITAGRVMSIPYTISALLSPILGFAVDKIGGRAITSMLASIMLVGVHIALALRTDSPVLPLVGQGCAYSLYAAVIWPSVPLTVRSNLVGTAFGSIMAIQNLGLSLFPIVIAAIHDRNEGRYLPSVEFFFVACAAIGSFAGLLLNVVDCCRSGEENGKLNRRKPKTAAGAGMVTSGQSVDGALDLDISSLVSHSTTL